MNRINEIRDRIAAGCVDADIIFLVGEHARLTNEREEARDLAVQRGEQLRRMREERDDLRRVMDVLSEERMAQTVPCPCAPYDSGAAVCLGCGGPQFIDIAREVDRQRERAEKAESERDARPEISAEDATNLLRWMLSDRAEACAEYPTPHWVDRVVDATSAHAAKAKADR